jgi:Flp pilus assembly pilin Flp
MVENALVVALIMVVAVAAVRVTGQTVSQQFSTVQAQLAPSNACSCPTQVAYVTAVYQQVLRRDPDPGGLSYWVSRISGGGTSRAQYLQLACSCAEYNALVATSGTQSQACSSGTITCSCS